ncbi:TylF/MycF/NovP-related O-methyltransferase [Azospirillum formosense]|uniref:TylF/MycF/NovP-related O-methyltransferase n=1 Tax=Azospirillum formosense TaxID=861533 RepID=UPI00338DA184
MAARLIDITNAVPETGYAWRAALPAEAGPGDTDDAPYASGLRLFEDGTEIGPAHSLHQRIRDHGAGRFSHWHGTLWFSPSDNSPSAPAQRRYQVLFPADGAQGLDALFEDVQAAVAGATDVTNRHQLVCALAARIYPEFTLPDHSRLLDSETAFKADLARMLDRPGVVADRRFALAQLARLALLHAGDVAECGCHVGASSYFMAQAMTAAGVQGRRLHLFDSFAGLPPPAGIDGSYWQAGDLACDIEQARRNLAPFDFVDFHPGWIPERFADVADRSFALVHIDVDLHAPTIDSLDFFYPRLTPGGLIVFDDYGFATCPGVTAAVDAFFKDRPEPIINLPSGGAFIQKQ